MKSKTRLERLPRPQADAGMTLFEVMIAAGVTLVAIVVAMGSIVSIATTSTVSETQVMATNIASSVLEQVRTLSLDDLAAFVPPADLTRRDGTAIQITCYDNGGNAHQTPFDPDTVGATFPNPLPVEVTVTWRDDQGRTYSKSSSVLVRR